MSNVVNEIMKGADTCRLKPINNFDRCGPKKDLSTGWKAKYEANFIRRKMFYNKHGLKDLVFRTFIYLSN